MSGRGADNPSNLSQVVEKVVKTLKEQPTNPDDRDGGRGRKGWSRRMILDKFELDEDDWPALSYLLRGHEDIRLIGSGRRWARWTHLDHDKDGLSSESDEYIDSIFKSNKKVIKLTYRMDMLERGFFDKEHEGLSLLGLMYESGRPASFRLTCPVRVEDALDEWVALHPFERGKLGKKRIENFSSEQFRSWIAQANTRSEVLVSLMALLGSPSEERE